MQQDDWVALACDLMPDLLPGDVDLKDAMPVRVMNVDNSAVRARQDGN